MSELRLIRVAQCFCAALCAAVLLASCGGGVDSGGTGSAFSSGPIDGFGSIIVNDVRFDDSAARIEDDDGTPLSRNDLKLGMFVRVDGSSADGNGTKLGVASSIRVTSAIVGPLDAVDFPAKTLTVLGQTVHMTPATAFDALPQGNNGLSLGSIVEVHGQFNRVTSRFVATRVAPRPNATFYKLRGPVTALDTAAKTLVVGGLTISYAQIAPANLPPLATGALLRLRLEPAPVAGTWVASALSSAVFALPERKDAQLEGRISALTSSRSFGIDGVQVDASNAVFEGSEAAVVLGARVEVEGESMGNVLLARLVKVRGDELPSNSSFELHGPVESLDNAANSFVVHGMAIDYDATVQFELGTASDLADGRQVLVIGVLSPDGSRIVATTIRFEGF